MVVTDERKREIIHNFMNTKYEAVKGYFYNKYPDLYLKMYNELMGGREISYGEK